MQGNKLKQILSDAQKGGYAVPHFNYASFFELRAILEAAAETRSPVFTASLPKVAETYHPEILAPLVARQAKQLEATAFSHLDHSNDIALCKRAVDSGYSSVMIDASRLPLEDNIAAVKEVAQYAHGKNCVVEGEIGKIKGRGDEGTYTGDDFLVDPKQAARLAEETNVDILAVGIGTEHGFYKGTPKINLERLSEVARLTPVPLVLHGGTGIPREDVRACIKGGIVKVNVGTIIRHTYLSAMRDEIEKQGAGTPPVDLAIPAVTDRIKQVVKDWIYTCMSNDKL